jgi:hypothetical protein
VGRRILQSATILVFDSLLSGTSRRRSEEMGGLTLKPPRTPPLAHHSGRGGGSLVSLPVHTRIIAVFCRRNLLALFRPPPIPPSHPHHIPSIYQPILSSIFQIFPQLHLRHALLPYFIMISTTYISVALFGAFSYALVADVPRQTSTADEQLGLIGWSPRPTDTPNHPLQIFGRQYFPNDAGKVLIAPDNTCGYISGLQGRL